MNIALERLARQLGLDAPGNERLRLAFGHACTQRVEHLLEEPRALDCLAVLGRYLDGACDAEALARAAALAAALANHHPGSTSIDGCGHAAVSATYAVASALAGKALRAAEYAAYAAVYGQGGYGAVSDPASFDIEHAWQADCLARCALPA
ncbi:MAG: hypothetical protein J0I68_09865 [Achromobacter sp.]|jgi:hypothetical protein|uniref:Uncharacterized protein n=1 Tax=Achromobacter insuavis TaxID=1287735 RepID=A0A6J5B3T2_9BURK|nr:MULTISPECIES: hypothetical protein [Achromobacter]MBN9638836.1 hypothetical protein [Achromobacter sp.]CAB3690780.1 hypothetical protein LMG26845_04733 [Achromobacter insuavis]CUJ16566.1 Uncharacterised protein [Achromobacter sp. 2789STDY5608633]CUJ55723.1 Uncharacterised protein [Achromobacter sp. 2789STDY5608628]